MKDEMKALITGGVGFIGSHLSERLLSEGWNVTIIDNLSTGALKNLENCLDHPNFSFAIDTILNETVLDRLVSECDVIFHLASAVGVKLIIHAPVEVIKTNVAGTDMMLKIATRYRKKILITSTSEVYGKSEKIPFSEEDDILIGPTTKRRWIYTCSKAIDEFAAFAHHKEFGLPVIIVRLFNTIGPRQTGKYGMVVPTFVSQALLGKPLTVYGSGE
jgi:UDP-glucose 4-epimerase